MIQPTVRYGDRRTREGSATGERATLGRWFALLLGAGALLVSASLLADLTPDANRRLGLACTLAMLAAAAAIFAARRRLAPAFYARLAIPVVILQLSLGIATSEDATNPMATFFVGAAAYSAFFFPWRTALAHLALAAPTYAAALLATTTLPAALDRWLFTIGMAAMTGWIVASLRDRLARQARTDWLTRVGNRRAFQERLSAELAATARAGRPLGVALVDVDRFKALNDGHGHDAGDAALQALADALCERATPGAVARLGGDEFGVLLPGARASAASAWGSALQARLRELGLAVTVSVGVASAPEHGLAPDALLRSADQALYRAKEAGRERPAPAPREEGVAAVRVA